MLRWNIGRSVHVNIGKISTISKLHTEFRRSDTQTAVTTTYHIRSKYFKVAMIINHPLQRRVIWTVVVLLFVCLLVSRNNFKKSIAHLDKFSRLIDWDNLKISIDFENYVARRRPDGLNYTPVSVSEMTYTVSSGTLNSSKPYPYRLWRRLP